MTTATSAPRQGGILRPALTIFAALSLITGLAYPFLTTGIASAVFPRQAAGSLIEQDGKVIGSAIVGQAFSSEGYFHTRPSAAGKGYDGLASSGSNLGPNSAALIERVQGDVAAQRAEGVTGPVPADLVTASGSGLDPDISPEAARAQVGRVARARGLDEIRLLGLVEGQIERPWLGLFGEPHINVLALNRALDRLR